MSPTISSANTQSNARRYMISFLPCTAGAYLTKPKGLLRHTRNFCLLWKETFRRGLLTLALSFDFKIFYTFSIDETVDLLSLLARRGGTSGFAGRPLIVKKPRITSTKEWQ